MNTLPETVPTVHAGLDVAKATLQLHLQGRQHALPNTPKGHRQSVALLRAVPGAHVVCEATGGYERPLVTALHAATIPVSVLNPARVRHFAQAQGRHAKNDPIDATVLTAFGEALRPAPTPVPDAGLAELRALVRWRAHLLAQRVATTNRSEHGTPPFVTRQQARLHKQLTAQLQAVETELQAALQRLPAWQAQILKLTELAGVGFLTAVAVLSQLPELGRCNRQEAAALAGLAPWTRQSGPWEGQRHIGGGRAEVRQALYMGAVAVARMKHTTLGKFYQRLRDAGKPAKVALTAVMRKLLLQMNRVLQPKAQTAAEPAAETPTQKTA
jgi:transposase